MLSHSLALWSLKYVLLGEGTTDIEKPPDEVYCVLGAEEIERGLT